MKVRTTVSADGFREAVRIGNRWFAQWDLRTEGDGTASCWRTEADGEDGIQAAIEREKKADRDRRINELKAYLAATDYVVIRAMETGGTEPEDIKTLRAAARTEINELEAQA